MKICLIKLDAPYLEYKFSDPPLGLLYVHAMLESKGYDVTFLDMAWQSEIPEADVYGISATSLDFLQVREVAKRIKSMPWPSRVIMGGPHPTLVPCDPGKYREIDIWFKGEGEALPDLLEGLQWFTRRRVFKAKPIDSLDSLPFPSRHVLRKDLYFHAPTVFMGQKFGEGNSATVMTSRGCPFSCSFCSSPKLWGHRVRYRSVGNVMEEIDHLIKHYNVHELRFQDDNFTLNRKWLNDICDQLAERKIFWRCSTRSNLIQYSMLATLWKGGCRELGFGIENAQDGVLDLLHKGLTVKQQMEALILAKNFGFRTRVFAMTGLPGETPDSGKRLVDFLEVTRPDVVTLTSFMPIPGSDIADNPEKYGGVILDRDFTKYQFNLIWEKGQPFAFKSNRLTLDQMEANRETLKSYIFNKGISNCFKFNRAYE